MCFFLDTGLTPLGGVNPHGYIIHKGVSFKGTSLSSFHFCPQPILYETFAILHLGALPSIKHIGSSSHNSAELQYYLVNLLFDHLRTNQNSSASAAGQYLPTSSSKSTSSHKLLVPVSLPSPQPHFFCYFLCNFFTSVKWMVPCKPFGFKISDMEKAKLNAIRVYTPFQYTVFQTFTYQVLLFTLAAELSAPFSNSPKLVVCSHIVSWGFTG